MLPGNEDACEGFWQKQPSFSFGPIEKIIDVIVSHEFH